MTMNNHRIVDKSDAWLARFYIIEAADNMKRFARFIKPVAPDLAREMRQEARNLKPLIQKAGCLLASVPDMPCPFDMLPAAREV